MPEFSAPPPSPTPTPAQPPRGPAAATWRVFGKSVRGASHVRGNLPNQDAIKWLPPDGRGLPIMLAVADGHGSAKYLRSDVGSRLAVEVALKELAEFEAKARQPLPDVDSASAGGSDVQKFNALSVLKNAAQQQLPQVIARRWREAVEKHLWDQPLTEKELASLEAAEGPTARASIAARPELSYGSTLMGVLIAEEFSLFLQLGDGDILIVASDGEYAYALPDDERLLANETTSLSGDNAWRDFRVAFQRSGGAPPALIMVSTDGCSNSFRSAEDFHKICPDILIKLHEQGIESVASELDPWLNGLSKNGSGDDISLGLIYRPASKSEGPVRRFRKPAVKSVAKPAAKPAAANSSPKRAPRPAATGARAAAAESASTEFVSQAQVSLRKVLAALRTWIGKSAWLLMLIAVALVVGGTAYFMQRLFQKELPEVTIESIEPEKPVQGAKVVVTLAAADSNIGPLKYQFRSPPGEGEWQDVEDRQFSLIAPRLEDDKTPGKLEVEVRSAVGKRLSKNKQASWDSRPNHAPQVAIKRVERVKSSPESRSESFLVTLEDRDEDGDHRTYQFCAADTKWNDAKVVSRDSKGAKLEVTFATPPTGNRELKIRATDAYGLESKADSRTLPLPPPVPPKLVWVERRIAGLSGRRPVTSLAMSRNGKWFASGDIQGNVRIVTPADQFVYPERHVASVIGLGFGDDDRSLISVDSDGALIIQHFPGVFSGTALKIRPQKNGEPVTAALDPSGSLAVIGTDTGKLLIFAAANGKFNDEVREPNGSIHSLSIGYLHGEWTLFCTAAGAIKSWALDGGKSSDDLPRLTGHLSISSQPPVISVAHLSGKTHLALARGHEVHLWENLSSLLDVAKNPLKDHKPAFKTTGAEITSLVLAPSGTSLLTGHADGSVLWWELKQPAPSGTKGSAAAPTPRGRGTAEY